MVKVSIIKKAVLVVMFLCLFVLSTGLWAEDTKAVSGGDLLKTIRQKSAEEKDVNSSDAKIAEKSVEVKSSALEAGTSETEGEMTAKVEMATKEVAVAQAITDPLLNMIPAESLVVLRLNNLDYTLSQVDQFVAGTLPIPGSLSMLVRTGMSGVLGSPQLAGVNTQGSFAAFLTAGASQGEPAINILVPVSDYQQFVEGNANVGQADANGVCKIGMTMQAIKAGDFVLVSPTNSYDGLVTTAKAISVGGASLARVIDAQEAQKAVKEPVWLYGDIQLVSKNYGPLLLAKIEEAKKMMEAMQASGQGPMGNPAEIIDMYASMLGILMKETKSVSVAINPKPDVLNITKTVAALPGSEMAGIFVTDSSAGKEHKFLDYLEDGAICNASSKKLSEKLNEKAMDFCATFFSKDAPEDEQAKLKTLYKDIADVFNGSDAITFFVDPQMRPIFKAKYIIEVKDVDRANKIIGEAVAFTKSGGLIAEFYKKMGLDMDMTVQWAVDSYKGVSIDSAKLVMKSTEPNSPQGQMIDMMYGGGLEYRWAMLEGRLVAVIGGDTDSNLRSLIDKVKAGGSTQLASEINSALTLVPGAKDADILCTFNLLRAMKMGMSFAPIPMPEVDTPTKSNLVMAGRIGGGKLTVDVALPKEHLTEIATHIMTMQQQMMEQQMILQQQMQDGGELANEVETEENAEPMK